MTASCQEGYRIVTEREMSVPAWHEEPIAKNHDRKAFDAKNERAADWYAAYVAVPLVNTPLTLVMSLATFATESKAKSRR